MQTSHNNPARNALGPGVGDATVAAAIERSGYPLQTLVSERLSKAFHVREEWSYVDRDTQGLRTIDIRASRRLYEPQVSSRTRVRPQLELIIECKKSELPLVFFATRHRPWLQRFPVVAGLSATDIECTTNNDLSTWSLPILNALGLDRHPFQKQPPVSNTFSKCVWRRAGELELSGDESYNGIVLPLVKAAAHLEESERPKPTFYYFDTYLAVPIAIVDGPMVLIELVNGAPVTTLVPWVRVARHEYDRNSDSWSKDRVWAIEVVHVDFLEEYLEKNLLPFASEFGRLALAHHVEMAEGKGFVSDLAREPYKESRLQPRPAINRVSRASSILWRIVTFPYWIWKGRD
jgi:hypothetical protein